jgi:hypothetical protein
MPGRGRRRRERKFTAFQERASNRQQNIRSGQLRRPPPPAAPDAPFTTEESVAIDNALAQLRPVAPSDHDPSAPLAPLGRPPELGAPPPESRPSDSQAARADGEDDDDDSDGAPASPTSAQAAAVATRLGEAGIRCSLSGLDDGRTESRPPDSLIARAEPEADRDDDDDDDEEGDNGRARKKARLTTAELARVDALLGMAPLDDSRKDGRKAGDERARGIGARSGRDGADV